MPAEQKRRIRPMMTLVCEYCFSSYQTRTEIVRKTIACSQRCIGQLRILSRRKRFELLLRDVTPNACVNWTGERDRDGYGRIGKGRHFVMTHRYSYEMHHGTIPDGLCVMHDCDNPSCINPFHLKVGTNLQNLQEKVSRGRHNRGETCHLSKLNNAAVREIRGSSLSLAELASIYMITPNTVRRVKQRKAWFHVD